MTQSSKEAYAAAIPACCEYQGIEAHLTGLGLCWGLIRAVEAGKPMDCRGCQLSTRPVFARSPHNGNER